MLSAGTIVALMLVGASITYGVVLVGFAKARRRLPLSWFALSCLMMVIYSIAMVIVTVPSVADEVIGWTGSIGYAAAAIFTLSATRYVYFRAAKEYSTRTRYLEWSLLAVAVIVFIPNAAFYQADLRAWRFFETPYRFPHSTYVLYFCAICIATGFANLVRVTWTISPKSLFIGCCCLVTAGGQDIAISLYFYESSFAAATGALVFLVALALDESVHWGDEATQLSDLKTQLEERVKERTDELSATLQKLARSERLASLGRLAASVGHEINNPLTYVLLNLELMKNEDGLEISGLEDAYEGAQRIAGIVAQLRILSKSTDQQHEVVDLDDVLRTAVRTVEHKIIASHRLRLESKANTAFVMGDRLRLTQLFINLLSNSIESLGDVEELKSVDVSVHVSEVDASIAITDEGEGISSEILDRLFEPFATGRIDGLGLGLAIAQTIVDEVGGTISVESQVGQGSTFTVNLPLTNQPSLSDSDDASEIDTDQVRYASMVSNARRVLIVDDEVGLTLSLKKLLREYDVTTCSSGHDALKRMEAETFDVVLCDFVMPEISGLEVFEQAIKLNAEYEDRFVLMSGGIPSAEMRERLNLSDTPFLGKPFRIAELREQLSKRLEKI